MTEILLPTLLLSVSNKQNSKLTPCPIPLQNLLPLENGQEEPVVMMWCHSHDKGTVTGTADFMKKAIVLAGPDQLSLNKDLTFPGDRDRKSDRDQSKGDPPLVALKLEALKDHVW